MLRTALAAACFPLLVPAQTFVVDASGAPGTQFTSIVAAVGAVPSGSVLLVRQGSYLPFAISGKALTVLGESGVLVTGPFQVANTAANQPVVVGRMQVMASGSALVLQQCQGSVRLYEIQPPPPYGSPRLVVTACGQVMVDSCEFHGGFGPPGATVTNTPAIVLRNTTILGAMGNGLESVGSNLQLVDSRVQGGAAAAPTAHGITSTSSDIRLLGASVIQAGVSMSQAISGSGSVRRGPSVTIGGAISGSLAVTATPEASLDVTGGALGAAVTAAMRGPVGALGVLMIGEPGAPVVVPSFQDPFSLLPASAIPVAAGVLGAAPLTGGVIVPQNPLLVGLSFGWQGITYSAPLAFTATNPAWFTMQ